MAVQGKAFDAKATVAKGCEIVPGALADGILGDDHHRGAELFGERRQPATADNQLALVIDERTGREQSEYVDHRSLSWPAIPVRTSSNFRDRN